MALWREQRIRMKYSEQEVRALVHENQKLKKALADSEDRVSLQLSLFDTMVTGSGDVIIVIGTETEQPDFVTSNVEKAFGIPHEEMCENYRRLFALAKQTTRTITRDDLSRLSPGGSVEFTTEFKPRGRTQTVWYRVMIRRCDFQNITKFVIIMQDITTSSHMNRRVQEILDVVEGSNRAKSDFLAHMSHDFRTPMNSIAGYVTLLRKNAANPEKIQEYANNISISLQSLLSLVNHVVDMSRAGNGGTSLDVGEFSLDIMCRGLAAAVDEQARRKNQQFVLDMTAASHDIFLGDQERIAEILMNLLTNSVNFTADEGHIRMNVSAVETSDQEFMDVVFEISDDGMGIEPQLISNLYEPFHMVHAGGMDARGAGLGLAITKKLIDLMNGHISVESTPGVGTVFTVTLRLQAVEPGNDDFWKEKGLHRILLIDSNPAEYARIQDLLESCGLETVCASSSYGGMQLIEQARVDDRPYDMILMDMNVEGMNGLETAKSLKNISWGTIPPILLMCEHPDMIRAQAEKSGVAAILPKPFFISGLRRAVTDAGLVFTRDQESGQAEEESTLSGMRFLAAEDNIINADILKELLEMEGAKCEIAGNGLAALAMFRNSRQGYYDMILMDLSMPIMDGYEATRQLRALAREDARTIPILAMTANTFAEDVEKSFSAGMNAHITKPLDIRVLHNTIHRLRKG